MKPRLFKSAADWREWLAENHDRAREIRLAYYKKGAGKTSVTYSEALDEALCFGWIDSTVNKLDAERYMQRWTPRHKGSIWSEINKARVKRLVAEGRMAAPGLAKIKAAKKDGSWNKLNDIDRIGRGGGPPPEVVDAIRTHPGLEDKFEALSASKKKMYSYWVSEAKRPETRARRIAKLPELIASGRLPGFPAPDRATDSKP
jgi:uncharacterized protein YdeI (YjbR/CyaY-like superfamily)